MGHAIAVVFLDSFVAFEESFLAHSIPLSAVGRNLVIFIEFFLLNGTTIQIWRNLIKLPKLERCWLRYLVHSPGLFSRLSFDDSYDDRANHQRKQEIHVEQRLNRVSKQLRIWIPNRAPLSLCRCQLFWCQCAKVNSTTRCASICAGAPSVLYAMRCRRIWQNITTTSLCATILGHWHSLAQKETCVFSLHLLHILDLLFLVYKLLAITKMLLTTVLFVYKFGWPVVAPLWLPAIFAIVLFVVHSIEDWNIRDAHYQRVNLHAHLVRQQRPLHAKRLIDKKSCSIQRIYIQRLNK